MNRTHARCSILWPGEQALEEVEAAIARGDEVDIVLPASEHHALCVRLRADATAALELAGGAELVARVASLPVLADLRRLVAALSGAGYRAELTGPPPVLSLLPAPHRLDLNQ